MADPARTISMLLTREEVIDVLRISPRSFSRHVAGTLSTVRVGRRTLYRREEVARWLREHEETAGGRCGKTSAPAPGPCVSATPAGAGIGAQARAIGERLRSRPTRC